MSQTIPRLKDRITSDRLLAVLAALAFAITAYFTLAFFLSVHTTTSVYSFGDVIWINQAFWNFTHHRPLQTSLYWVSGEGVIGNPYSYSSQIAMHVNWFPYAFAPLYSLMPNIEGLYAIVFLWNYLGIAFFTWKIVSHLTTEHVRQKYLFLLAMFLGGSFFSIIGYKALFLLFCGPLIAALFYFLISRQRAAFLVTGILLCLVSEDAAMFAVGFSGFAFLFYPKQRDYAVALGVLAVTYLALVVRVIVPATKYDLTLATHDASDVVIRLKKLLSGDYPYYWRSQIPICLFIGASFAAAAGFFRRTAKTEPLKIAALVFVAPATHWIISISQDAGHHLLPVAVCVLLALTVFVGNAKYENRAARKAPAVLAAFAMALVLMRTNLRIMRWGLVMPFRYSRLVASDPQIASNRALLDAAAAIPPEASVSYWTNRGLDGYLSSRSDVWRFPKNFDETDYLLIQKDGTEGFWEIKPPFDGKPREMAERGTFFSSGTTAPNRDAAARIVKNLVDEAGSHVVALENEHFVFLKRKEHFDLPMPPFSLGLGWLSNVPKLGTKKVP